MRKEPQVRNILYGVLLGLLVAGFAVVGVASAHSARPAEACLQAFYTAIAADKGNELTTATAAETYLQCLNAEGATSASGSPFSFGFGFGNGCLFASSCFGFGGTSTNGLVQCTWGNSLTVAQNLAAGNTPLVKPCIIVDP